MNDNDYIILFDQNGSPYIAHASLSAVRQRTAGALRAVGNAANTAKEGVGRGVRATHKYIDKIVENGKTRYFYTQEELKAYYNEQRGKVNQKVGEAQEKAEAARLRMERMGNEFKDKAQNTASETKASAKAYKEYQDANKAQDPKRITEAWSELQKHPAAMKAEMSRRKVAEAGEAIENTASKVKDKATEITSNAKEGAAKAKEELIQNLKDHRGSPSNSSGETRSMLGSYATEIPSSPDKLKEWADKGKEQAQHIMKEAEQALKEIQQGYENGEYTQYQMWTAQNIVDGMRDELSEWEFLSGMSGNDLAQLFKPLLKAKK